MSTESLQQLLERALTPLVDEVKQKGLAPACPSCQRLHKKILVPGTMGCHDPSYFCVWQGVGSPGSGVLLACGRDFLGSLYVSSRSCPLCRQEDKEFGGC